MLILAHRGASTDAPENTLLAFEGAINQGADGIEFDVFPCDDTFVVIHDKWVHRTTNGKGQLSDYSFEHLRELDAGYGQKIPTLRETLLLIGNQCQINIEVKAECCVEGFIRDIVDCQQLANISDEAIIISSFHHVLLKRIKDAAPQWRYGALSASYAIDKNQFAQTLGAWSVNIDLSVVDKALIEDAHQRDLKALVYTVDEEADLLKLKSWGVDGIFTNKPAASREILSKSEQVTLIKDKRSL
jgi:glycerophosphoryl diester phosphodiesterase